jgi:hypothetical protein
MYLLDANHDWDCDADVRNNVEVSVPTASDVTSGADGIEVCVAMVGSIVTDSIGEVKS